MYAHKERPGWDSVYAQNEAIKDVFPRCLKKSAVQVCTLTIMHCRPYLHVLTYYDSLCSIFSIRLSVAIPVSRRLICNINWRLFSRLKINHDVHEFILDSGTVANNNKSVVYVMERCCFCF
jgi:hypothetical protein